MINVTDVTHHRPAVVEIQFDTAHNAVMTIETDHNEFENSSHVLTLQREQAISMMAQLAKIIELTNPE